MLNKAPFTAGVIAGLLLLPVAAPAMAEDGLDWFRQMQRAQRVQAIEGIAVYAHDGRIDAIEITHRPWPQSTGQFANLGGDRRQLMRQGDQIRVQMAGATVGAWPAFARFSTADAEHIGRYYKVREVGVDQVAGLDAVVVRAEPNDDLRFVQQMWFDRASGMMLGNMVLDQRQQPLEQITFTAIRTSNLIDAAPSEPESAQGAPHASSVPLTLPAGFMFVGERHDDFRNLDQFLITDGLALVSIYRESKSAANVGDFASRRGAVNLYGRQSTDLRLVAIGNVPLPTLRELVDANAGP